VVLADRVRVASASPGWGWLRSSIAVVPSVCHTRWIDTSASSGTAPQDTEFTWHRRTTRPPAFTNYHVRLIRNQQVAGSIPGGGLCLFCFCPSLHARPSGAYTRARRYRTSSLSATATGAPTVNERRTGSAAVSPALPNCCQTGPNYAAPP